MAECGGKKASMRGHHWMEFLKIQRRRLEGKLLGVVR
jgi:hypothetical protein